MCLLKLLAVWLQAWACTLVAVAGMWLVLQYVGGWRLLQVQTDSMRPGIRPGDVLVMRPVAPQYVQPGMVVSYPSAHLHGELVTHRVFKLQGTVLWTKGDALHTADPPVSTQLVHGQIVAVLPRMGAVFGWLRTWQGLAICVYVPAGAIVWSELRRLRHSYPHPAKNYYAPDRTVL